MPPKAFPGCLPWPADTLNGKALGVGSWESPAGQVWIWGQAQVPLEEGSCQGHSNPEGGTVTAGQPSLGQWPRGSTRAMCQGIWMDLGDSGRRQEGCVWEQGR